MISLIGIYEIIYETILIELEYGNAARSGGCKKRIKMMILMIMVMILMLMMTKRYKMKSYLEKFERDDKSEDGNENKRGKCEMSVFLGWKQWHYLSYLKQSD